MIEGSAGFFIGCGAFALILCVIGQDPVAQRRKFELEAVAAGVARYEANPTNGVVTFKWIGGAK